jgi:hypothetical protein
MPIYQPMLPYTEYGGENTVVRSGCAIQIDVYCNCEVLLSYTVFMTKLLMAKLCGVVVVIYSLNLQTVASSCF